MDNIHSFAGYIDYCDNQYFCTINNHVVKMFNKNEHRPVVSENALNAFRGLDVYTEDKKEKYLFGFDESNRLFAVLSIIIKENPFSHHAPYSFFAPILIRGESITNDLSFFDAVDFYGESVNKIYDPPKDAFAVIV
jgi:hypothetical protein